METELVMAGRSPGPACSGPQVTIERGPVVLVNTRSVGEVPV